MIVMFFKLFENAMNKKINIETMSHIIERSDFIQHGQCIYQMFFNIKNPSLSVNFFFKAMGLKKWRCDIPNHTFNHFENIYIIFYTHF